MTDTTHKSPSKLKRDQLRMTEFNLRKLQETFQSGDSKWTKRYKTPKFTMSTECITLNKMVAPLTCNGRNLPKGTTSTEPPFETIPFGININYH